MRGVESSRLKVTMVMWLALNSAHLDNPLAVEVIDPQGSGALHLLEMAQKATCPDFFGSFPKLNLSTLNGTDLKGTTIIAENSSGLKKVAPQLNQLLATQHLSTHITAKGKYGDVEQKREISGPIGCVMVTKEPPFLLSDLSFLKLYLSSGQNILPRSLSEAGQALFDTLCGIIRASIRRIKPRLIIGNFPENLLTFFYNTGKSESELRKVGTFGRMIRLIHLINNPPPVYRSEVLSDLLGVPQDSLKLVSKNPSQPATAETVCNRIDYYIFWSIMNGLHLLREDDPYLTPRQGNILQFMADCEELLAPGETPGIWLSPEKILAMGEAEGRETIKNVGITVLRKELKKMSEMRVIREGKGIGGKFKYFLDTTKPVLDPVYLPPPSQGADEISGQSRIKILNPITGEIEEV